MIKCRLSELANVLDCVMPEVDVTVESIVSDSRKVHYGALFAALPGSQVDGHDYAESAARMGAAALLVNRKLNLEIPQLVVADVPVTNFPAEYRFRSWHTWIKLQAFR